jgi:hypothetical protein
MKKLFSQIQNCSISFSLGITLCFIGYILAWGIFLYVPDTIRANKVLNGEVIQYNSETSETLCSSTYMIKTDDGLIKLKINVWKQVPFESEGYTSIRTYDITGANYFNQNLILWFVKDDLLRKYE